MSSPTLYCWPDRLQELLLRATMLKGAAARRAWEEWISAVDFNNLDQGSHRLLPETYTNLKSIGVDHELFGIMKGVKRRTWLQNQLLFHQATAALKILQDCGMETMVTKGPALALLHYRDLGRRPMSDFDIVVPRDRAEEAVRALVENGFRRKDPEKPGRGPSMEHAASYVNETGRQFDLHWQVLAGCTDSSPFWNDASPLQIEQMTVLAPSPSDLLFHICVHGLRLNRVPPLRWIVDASIIIRESRVDWDRVEYMSKRFSFTHHMREALRFLKRFEVEIPDQPLRALSSKGPVNLQELEFDLKTGRRRKSFGTQLAVVWLGFKRYADPESNTTRLAQLRHYLEIVWNASSAWSLTHTAIRKGARRLFVNPSD